MTRRAAVLAALLAPFGAQSLLLYSHVSEARLVLSFTKKPTDKMLEVVWSDGSRTTLTEADVRSALEER